jgi:hypothetical protein
MKKMLLAVALTAAVLLCVLDASAADVVQPPVISDMAIDGLPFKTKATNQKLTIRFTSDQRPADVLVDFMGSLPGRTLQTSYSSKKNELDLVAKENGGQYDVAVTRGYGSPPFASTVDVSVWVVGSDGKTKSNKLVQKVEIVE